MLTKDRHQSSLSRVIAKAVLEQDLHLVTLCEVGGHKQGLNETNVRAQDLVSRCSILIIRPHPAKHTWQRGRRHTEPDDDHQRHLDARRPARSRRVAPALSSRSSLSWCSPLLLRSILTSTGFSYLENAHPHADRPRNQRSDQKTDHEGSDGGLGGESVDCEQWRFSAYCASHCAHRRREHETRPYATASCNRRSVSRPWRRNGR